MTLHPFMLSVPCGPGLAGGQRFALWHPPQSRARGAVLYVHPLAEELNKTRRMAAMQARALAQAGWGVLQVDLLGCGDSPGEFEDARWADWVHDLKAACNWLQLRLDGLPLTLWGLRSGCLLATALASQWPLPCNFLLWQPAIHGEAVVRQWLRQGAAAALLDGRGPGSTAAMQAELAADRCIEIGGYRLHPALIEALSSVSLQPPALRGPAVWLEVRNSALPLPHASEAWTGPAPLTAEAVPGPAFWQTSEIALAPALIERSLALLEMYTSPSERPAETP
jgi:exosortase A-associated hydrolase 2